MEQWYKTYTAEQIRELGQPYADQLELAGYNVQWDDETNWQAYYSGFHIYYMDNCYFHFFHISYSNIIVS